MRETAAAGQLHGVQRWIVYYGFGKLELLSRFELAVLAPGGHRRAELFWLKERGVRLLAYVSALEVSQQAEGLAPDNVLCVGTAPFCNEEFGNWVLDPRRSATSRRLNALAEAALDAGYDGLFLDTLGIVEDRRLSAPVRGELVPAAAWLVAELASQFPSVPLVQNWGFEQLLPLTAPWLAGVCWEDFPWRDIGLLPTSHAGVRKMVRLQEARPLRVFALNQGLRDPAERMEAQAAAERCGFAWYGAPTYLEPVPREDVTA